MSTPGSLTPSTLRERLHRLEGQMKAKADALAEQEVRVAVAKGRLVLRPDIEGVLEALGRRAHERSVGQYERLLSALVRDTLPESGQSVRLTLETRRDLPALAIEAVREEGEGAAGEGEDILNGNGGSLTNVVVAGLRYIALARGAQRRFIILDEPDCWLRPDRIPAFAGVIQQLAEGAEGAGIQTLLISHHDAALFGASFAVHLAREGKNGVRVALSGGKPPAFPEDHPGIRQVRLVNCLSHEDTVVPLAPGVTLLTGDNNVGKSAVVTALRAMAYGDGTDALIRHGADSARVEIMLPGGETLSWERRRKGNPKTLYRLTDASGQTVHEGGAGKEVPDWAQARLGIAPIEGLDVQIGNQKTPVFLLDEPDTKRAAILSVGRESGRLNDMQRAWKAQLDEDRRTLREGEPFIARTRALLDSLGPVMVKARSTLDDLAALNQKIVDTKTRADALVRTGDRLSRLSATLAWLSPLRTLKLPDLPQTRPVEAMEQSARRIESAQSALRRLAPLRTAVLPAIPELSETQTMAERADRIERLRRTSSRLSPLRVLRLPDIREPRPTDAMAESAQRIESARAALHRLAPLRDASPPPVPVLRDVATMIDLGRRIHAHGKLVARLSPLRTLSLPSAPNLCQTSDMDSAGRRLEDLVSRRSQAGAEAEETRAELGKIDMERQDLERELGVCPLCGNEFAPDHAHDQNEERAPRQ